MRIWHIVLGCSIYKHNCICSVTLRTYTSSNCRCRRESTSCGLLASSPKWRARSRGNARTPHGLGLFRFGALTNRCVGDFNFVHHTTTPLATQTSRRNTMKQTAYSRRLTLLQGLPVESSRTRLFCFFHPKPYLNWVLRSSVQRRRGER